MVVDDRLSVGYPMIERVAREFSDKMPPGTTLDDLRSLGGEELLRANNSFDPADGRPWQGFLVKWLRYQFRDYLRTARKRAKRQHPLEFETKDGERLPRSDPRAVDPAGEVECRDTNASGRDAVARLKATMPPVDRVAAKAKRLIEETLDAVRDGEMGEVLRAVMKRAKAGDLAAVKLLWEMFGILFTPHHSSEGY